MIDDLSDMSNGEDVFENDVDSEGAPKISSTNPERPPQLPVAPGHVGVSNTTNSKNIGKGYRNGFSNH